MNKTMSELKKNWESAWDKFGYCIDDCTCNQCYPDPNEIVECKYAFDLYNTNGDCLASK